MDAQDRGPQVIAVSYALLVIVTLVVMLRFYGRYIVHKAEFW